MADASKSPSLYALVGAAVRRRSDLGAFALVGAAMHSAGHAFLAAAAGTLTRALAGGGLSLVAASSGVLGERSDDGEWTLRIALAGVAAALLKLAGGAVASWAEARISGEVAMAVRLRVLDDVLSLASAGARGSRLAALTSHVQDVERGVASGVLAELRALVQLAPLLALLVLLAPQLAATAVVALGAFGVLAFALRRAFKRSNARAVASTAALVGAADEAVRHAELWATYGAQDRIRAHVARLGRAIAREAATLRVRSSILSSTSEVLGALALVLVLLLAARGALELRAGLLVPFAIVFFMAYRPLRDLVDARLARSRGEEALAAALTPSAVEATAHEPSPSAPPAWRLESLVLTNVRTSHGAHAALSVRVPPGSVIAVVGPTGIGKTSLLRVLLGLDPLAEGEIRYGDVVLSDAGIGPAERPFAWVPQEAPVVADTLAVNVGLGQSDGQRAVSGDSSLVLEELGARALVEALGEEVLAPGRLSGGERQWVAVARAFATGLPVLLLDEPTSALDAASQDAIHAAVRRLRGRRTVILVTHRPEPLAIADVVVRLEVERDAPSRPHSVITSSGGPAVTSSESA